MLVLSIILLLVGIYAYKINRGMDLLTLFCFLWSVVFGFASLKLYGMREYSNGTVLLFATGTLSVVIFAFLGRYGKYKSCSIKQGLFSKLSRENLTVNKKMLCVFLVPITFFVIYSVMRMLTLYSSGVPLGTIHAMYLGRGGENFFTLNILSQIHSKMIIPLLYCMIPIVVYYTLTDFKNNWIVVGISTLDIFLYMVATGSRVVAIFIFVDILLVLPFANIVLTRKTFRKIKRIGFFFIAVVLILLIAYTISRKEFVNNSESSIFHQLFGEIYKYFSLCVPLSDYWISEVNSNKLMTYGKMSIYGLISLIEWFFVRFFKTDMFSWLDICRNLASDLEVMQPIFADAKCNAFVTYIFYFYVDFGIIGVIIFSSILGFACGKISRKMKKKHNESTLLFYLLFAQTISMSFSRWSFFDAPYVLAFLYMRLLFIGSRSKVLTKK